MNRILMSYIVIGAICFQALLVADNSLHRSYGIFKAPGTEDVVEELMNDAQFFGIFVQDRGEKFLRSKMLIPTNTKIPVLLNVQDDKITTVVFTVYTKLMAETVTKENLGRMKKYYSIIETLDTLYGDETSQKKTKSKDIKKDLQQKDKEIKDAEKKMLISAHPLFARYHHRNNRRYSNLSSSIASITKHLR